MTGRTGLVTSVELETWMPFPFLPTGAALAAAVLAGAFVVFGLAVRLTGRIAAGMVSSLPGIVAGVRRWTSGGDPRSTPRSPSSS